MASYDLEGGRAKKTEEKRWCSWIVPFFVAVNIVVFVVTMYINNCPSHQNDADQKCLATVLRRFSFQPFKENPLLGPSSATLEKMGALQWYKIVHQHQGWRLVSCIWLHAGFFHLLANMVCLVFIGIRLEQQFGFVRIGIIYLLSGFGGSMLSAFFIKTSISVGASGALFGLFGAMLSELITNWTIYSNKVSALLTLLFVMAINLAIGIVPYIDNFAHIGGFLTGMLLGFIFLLRPQFRWLERHNLPTAVQVKSKYKIYQLILFGMAIILLPVWFVVGLVMLFRGENGNDHCHWCNYLSCVPTSRWECNN